MTTSTFNFIMKSNTVNQTKELFNIINKSLSFVSEQGNLHELIESSHDLVTIINQANQLRDKAALQFYKLGYSVQYVTTLFNITPKVLRNLINDDKVSKQTKL